VYLKLGRLANNLLQSPDPKIVIRFPKQQGESKNSAAKQTNARKSVVQNGEWLSVRPKAAKRKQAEPKKVKAKKVKPTTKNAAAKKIAGAAKGKAKKGAKPTEVIELSSDDDDDSSKDLMLASLPRQQKDDDALWHDPESSDGEFEFE
jgi:hypothetical protein